MLIFVLALLALPSKPSLECPPLGEVRKHYKMGEAEKSISELRCHLKKNEKDTDARRLLSDIYWWEGEVNASRLEAKQLQQALPADVDDDTKIYLQRRLAKYKLGFSYEDIFASRNQSYEMQALASAKYYKKNELQFTYSRLSRVFDGTPWLSDQAYSLSHVGPLLSDVYLENSITYSHDPNFLADWAFGITPHYVLKNEWDLALGFKYGYYETEADVISIKPQFQAPILPWLTGGLKIEASLAPKFTISSQEFLRANWGPRFFAKESFGGGQSFEGQGLVDTFYSGSVSFGYSIIVPVIVQIYATFYQGEIRDENHLGGAIEYSF